MQDLSPLNQGMESATTTAELPVSPAPSSRTLSAEPELPTEMERPQIATDPDDHHRYFGQWGPEDFSAYDEHLIGFRETTAGERELLYKYIKDREEAWLYDGEPTQPSEGLQREFHEWVDRKKGGRLFGDCRGKVVRQGDEKHGGPRKKGYGKDVERICEYPDEPSTNGDFRDDSKDQDARDELGKASYPLHSGVKELWPQMFHHDISEMAAKTSGEVMQTDEPEQIAQSYEGYVSPDTDSPNVPPHASTCHFPAILRHSDSNDFPGMVESTKGSWESGSPKQDHLEVKQRGEIECLDKEYTCNTETGDACLIHGGKVRKYEEKAVQTWSSLPPALGGMEWPNSTVNLNDTTECTFSTSSALPDRDTAATLKEYPIVVDEEGFVRKKELEDASRCDRKQGTVFKSPAHIRSHEEDHAMKGVPPAKRPQDETKVHEDLLKQYEHDMSHNSTQCYGTLDDSSDSDLGNSPNISHKTAKTQTPVRDKREEHMDITNRYPNLPLPDIWEALGKGLSHEKICAMDRKAGDKNQHSDKNDDWKWLPVIRDRQQDSQPSS